MADSELTISSLTATGAAGQIVLEFVVDNPNANGLPYLFLKHVEVWAATTNNRGSATKIADAAGRQYAHTGLAASATRYYWVRPVNASGYTGDYYPASSTAGVSGTSAAAELQPGSVGNDELADNAVTADKISVSSLSAITANIGSVTAGTVTGVLVRTGSGNDRVQLNQSNNAAEVYSGGLRIGHFGGTDNDYVLHITPDVSDPAIFVAANVGGQPGSSFWNFGNNPAVHAVSNSTGGESHGLRAENNQSGGGSGVVGQSGADGGRAFYAETGTYGPFTGSHDALISKDAEIEIGDIVVDVRVLARNGISDTLTEVERSSVANQKAALGVVARRTALLVDATLGALPRQNPDTATLRQELCENYDRLTVNAVGEGQMNVCGRGGDIEAGDFICSSDLPGKGMRQDSDVKHSYTVARAREAVTFDNADQVRLVACTYEAG